MIGKMKTENPKEGQKHISHSPIYLKEKEKNEQEIIYQNKNIKKQIDIQSEKKLEEKADLKRNKRIKHCDSNGTTNNKKPKRMKQDNVSYREDRKQKIGCKENEINNIIELCKDVNTEEHNGKRENHKGVMEKEMKKEKKKKKKELQQNKEEGISQIIQTKKACRQFNWFTHCDESKESMEHINENVQGEKAKKNTKKKNIKYNVPDDMNTDRKADSEGNNSKAVKATIENQKCTPVDFERLVTSAKNSSVAWISYISYYIERGDINKARNIAERALKTVDMNKTEDKLNIYLCYLNMECLFGDKLEDIFKRALIYNDEKKVYLHMIHMLKTNKKLKQLKEICEKAIKRFKHSKKIWICYLEVLHSVFMDEETAYSMLLKSLHSLPKRKHLHMIISAARFEYKYSNRERGKAYFEKLIAEFPKRSDIWFTYIDVHISSLLKGKREDKKGRDDDKGKKEKKKRKLDISELESVRSIFERFSTHKFKPRVMKLIFTKWLLFERNYGSQYHEKLVQQKAYAYVESLNVED